MRTKTRENCRLIYNLTPTNDPSNKEHEISRDRAAYLLRAARSRGKNNVSRGDGGWLVWDSDLTIRTWVGESLKHHQRDEIMDRGAE